MRMGDGGAGERSISPELSERPARADWQARGTCQMERNPLSVPPTSRPRTATRGRDGLTNVARQEQEGSSTRRR